MLVLTRKRWQSLWIGEDVRITVVKTGRARVQLAIEAPRDAEILREELLASAASPRGMKTLRSQKRRLAVPV
jgi:carbon storage regulator